MAALETVFAHLLKAGIEPKRCGAPGAHTLLKAQSTFRNNPKLLCNCTKLPEAAFKQIAAKLPEACLLYTSDAADDM
eukprot:12798122-Alexandrium_andersonii.AAC.1